MESQAHAPLRPVTRGRGMWASILSMYPPGSSTAYNASQMIAKIGVFNSDIVGGYGTDPMQFSDVPVDKYGLVKYNTGQTHYVWDRTGGGGLNLGPLSSGSLNYRPLASYFWLNDGTSYSLQAIRFASSSPNYIIVRMQFDYGFGSPVLGNWRNFSLYDSGPLLFTDAITLPVPVPTSGELTDPMPNYTGWAHVPFFGLSWTDFQNRYV